MIIITGGHLTPALSLIDALRKAGFTNTVFIGRRQGQEEALVTARGVRFLGLTAGKLYRHFAPAAIVAFLTIPIGLVQAWLILRTLRPRLVVSFGGYIALAVCLTAWVKRIPILTHEQGTRVGLANWIIGRLARKVAISWPGTRVAFPARKTLLTGNPIRSAITQRLGHNPLGARLTRPLIYVTGGNQGSKIINRTLLAILPQLTERYTVVHQTGSADWPLISRLNYRHYFPFAWLDDQAVSWCLYRAALVISRAGANTVTELAFTGAPALLIPLPRSQQNEQWHNASLLVAAGTGRILLQAELTPLKLHQEIDLMLSQQAGFRRRAPRAARLVNPNAAAKLADLVLTLYEPKNLDR